MLKPEVFCNKFGGMQRSIYAFKKISLNTMLRHPQLRVCLTDLIQFIFGGIKLQNNINYIKTEISSRFTLGNDDLYIDMYEPQNNKKNL